MLEVRRSFDRARQAGFAQRFYDILLASSPLIAIKFADTDLEKQHELLVYGVYSMLDYAEGHAVGKLALERLAKRHGPGDIDVSSAMLKRWLSSFLEALRLTDPNFNGELETFWREALKPGLARLGLGRVR